LPLEAVQGDNVFQLNLEDMQNTQVYRINGTEAYWHDSNVVTIIEEPTSTSESSTKETPAPFALLLVALALLARRR
jgi:MYXO-CTERM domain-containing protein